MLMVPGVDDADFSSLETIVYGASPISEEVLAKCVDTFGCKFWQAYGLTETTGAVVNLAPEDHDTTGPNRHRLRSCGLPGPGVELRIVGRARRVRRPRGGRDLDPLAAEHDRLLEPARGDRQGVHRGRLVPVGRRRLSRRGRLPLHPRPGEGHDRVGRRERVPGRGGERADGPSRDRRRRRHRRAGREVGRDGQGDRRASRPAAK